MHRYETLPGDSIHYFNPFCAKKSILTNVTIRSQFEQVVQS